MILDFLGSIFSGIFDLVLFDLQKEQSRHLTGAEQEQNAFNAAEAEKQRQAAWDMLGAEQDFNALEAQKNRDFQESMSNTQYQRTVADMKSAGINPALAVSNGPVSSPSGSAASSPSQSLAAASGSGSGIKAPISMSDLLSSLRLTSEIGLLKAQERKALADAERQRVEAWRTETLTPVQVDDIVSQIDLRKVQMNESEVRTAVYGVDYILKNKEIDWFDTEKQFSLLESRQRVLESRSNTKRNQQLIRESEEQIKNFKQERAESISRVLVNEANAGKIDAETLKALEEIGILRLDAEQKAYRNEHLDGDRVWSRIQTVGSAISGIGVGVGAAFGGIGRAAGGFLSESFRSRSSRKPSPARNPYSGNLYGSGNSYY